MKYHSLNCDNKITENFNNINSIVEHGLIGRDASSTKPSNSEHKVQVNQSEDVYEHAPEAHNYNPLPTVNSNTQIDNSQNINTTNQNVADVSSIHHINTSTDIYEIDYTYLFDNAISDLVKKCGLTKDEAIFLTELLKDDKMGLNYDCFLEGTEVTMYDGTKKDIKLLNVGDIVMSFNLLGKINSSKVSQIYKKKVIGYYVISTNNSELKVTSKHPIYIGNGKFQLVKNLRIGDEIIRSYKNEFFNEKVTDISFINEEEEVFNMHVENDNTYFANDIAVHNKSNTFIVTSQENNRYNEINLLVENNLELTGDKDKSCIVETLFELDNQLDQTENINNEPKNRKENDEGKENEERIRKENEERIRKENEERIRKENEENECKLNGFLTCEDSNKHNNKIDQKNLEIQEINNKYNESKKYKFITYGLAAFVIILLIVIVLIVIFNNSEPIEVVKETLIDE